MSLVRWGQDGSSVYIINDVRFSPPDDFCCVMCDDGQGLSDTQLVEHLKQHQAKGDTVPAWVFEALV
jgi:hypothetical protein